MPVLKLPGGTALSDFRLEKLNVLVGCARPGLLVLAAQHWHFVEVELEPTADDRAVLQSLLSYGPEPPPPVAKRGRAVLVTPRLGTRSPWSSKATDIARQCGLGVVQRIERGTLFHLEGDGPGSRATVMHDGLLTEPERRAAKV